MKGQRILEFVAASVARSLRCARIMEHATSAHPDRRLSLWRQAIGDTALPAHEEIAARAHAIYLQRGGTGGSDLEDWLQAERDHLLKRTWEIQKLTPR